MATRARSSPTEFPVNPWVYLVWLGFLLLPLQRGRPFEWWATGAATAVFVAVYFWGFHGSGPRLWISRLAIFGLGVGLFPYNAFAHTFFIYAGMPGSRSKTVECVVVMLLTLIGSYAFLTLQHLDSIYFGLILVIVLGFGAAILVARAQRISRTALAGKDVEIARLAQLAERERIARDIHDLLGHTLSLIAIKADLACKLADRDPSQAAIEMGEVAQVARSSLAEVREAISGMHKMGVIDALKATDSLLRAAGLETELQPVGALPPMTEAQERALAQSLLEAGTNVVRHAQATRVSLAIVCEPSRISIRVEDNGHGGALVPGNGINGMRARLQALNGTVSFVPLQPGLSLVAELPL